MQVHLPGCPGSEGTLPDRVEIVWQQLPQLRPPADDSNGCSHSSSLQERHPPSANSLTQTTRGISLQAPLQ